MVDDNRKCEGAVEALFAVDEPKGGIDSRQLFARSREILIRHEDMLYRLRLTSNNKLILTK